jgi:hypothetical protein
MVAPIKQIVIVGADGRIELRATDLTPGSQAEVTVRPLRGAASASLNALDALQRSLQLDHGTASQWAARTRDERLSFPRGS